MNNQEPQPFGFEMSNSMAGDSQMMGSQKSMDQGQFEKGRLKI